MKRLTYRKGNKTYAAKSTRTMCFCDRPYEERMFCVRCHYGKQDRTNCGPLAIIDRLADYEDTGLEPEEIKALLTPPNPPLTLEELREMDGEPVLVTSSIGEQPMWYIVDVEENELKNPWDRITLEGWDKGYPYKAYRRKLEPVQRREKR